jgi:hypothetical protein
LLLNAIRHLLLEAACAFTRDSHATLTPATICFCCILGSYVCLLSLPPLLLLLLLLLSSGDGGDAERSAIPLRVRQVAAVELAAGVTQLPESVLVLLEGGGEVAADRLSEAELKDIDGHKVHMKAEDAGVCGTQKLGLFGHVLCVYILLRSPVCCTAYAGLM